MSWLPSLEFDTVSKSCVTEFRFGFRYGYGSDREWAISLCMDGVTFTGHRD